MENFLSLAPEFITQEDQDALSFKISDRSIWGVGDQALTSIAELRLAYYDTDRKLITFDPYQLIAGVNKDKFYEFISNVGHRVMLSSLLIDGQPHGMTRFPDGYYILRMIFNTGNYDSGAEPTFVDNQGFLAHARTKTRKTPILLKWPMSDQVRRTSTDIQMLRMYLDAAEEAVDLGKYVEFLSVMEIMNTVFDYYKINESF